MENNPSRDLETSSGEKLTIINTPYLLRDIENNYMDSDIGKARMVSREPINPLNKSDDWEELALISLANGLDKVSEIVIDDNGQDIMRLIRPFYFVAF